MPPPIVYRLMHEVSQGDHDDMIEAALDTHKTNHAESKEILSFMFCSASGPHLEALFKLVVKRRPKYIIEAMHVLLGIHGHFTSIRYTIKLQIKILHADDVGALKKSMALIDYFGRKHLLSACRYEHKIIKMLQQTWDARPSMFQCFLDIYSLDVIGNQEPISFKVQPLFVVRKPTCFKVLLTHPTTRNSCIQQTRSIAYMLEDDLKAEYSDLEPIQKSDSLLAIKLV